MAVTDVNIYLAVVLAHLFEEHEKIFNRGHSDHRYQLTPPHAPES